MTSHLKIGISACFMYPDPNRVAFNKKTLQYVEQSVPHWVMSGGALPVMIINPNGDTFRGPITINDYAQWLDGLVLHGGADVWPGSYQETPLKEAWNGDKHRDEYEIALVKAFVAQGKPVFGICRGMQLINVAFGGTLYQDIPSMLNTDQEHRHSDRYDQNFHQLEIVEGSRLDQLLAGHPKEKINSVHHQAVKDLAPNFTIEARCPNDKIVEAIRHTGNAWVAGVQWHPEFHKSEYGTLNDEPLLKDFLAAAEKRKNAS